MEFLSAHVDAVIYAIGLVALLLLLMPFSPMMIDILLLPRGLQLAIYRYRYLLWAIVWAAAAILLIRGLNAIAEPSGLLAPLVAMLKGLLGDWGPSLFGAGDPVWITVTLVTIAIAAFMFWSGYVPYVMTPPANPKLLDVKEADSLLKDDDMVLGVVNGADVHAYPRDYIARPHFFADVVGGEQLTISYCILCNSGTAFRSELKGRPLKLKCVTAYNNNIIYYDPATRNFIQQLDGAVIEGPDAGAQLDQHPVVQARWGDWKELHPDTKLYYAPEKSLRDKMVGAMLQMLIPIRKLAKRTKPWHRIRGRLDPRLPAMSYVYAIEINGERKAYAESDLREARVINDSVGGEPLVVLYDAQRDVGDIFSRRVEGRVLTFSPASGADGAIARDDETGSTWRVTGKAVAGPLAGQRLQELPHYNKLFWFSWPLFKPDTSLVRAANQ
ncbi:MAG: DUF3179 domain-containing (seleno)protein [Rhodothalassiaceae bacterium]